MLLRSSALVPPPLAHASELLALLRPTDIVVLLMEIWEVLVQFPPAVSQYVQRDGRWQRMLQKYVFIIKIFIYFFDLVFLCFFFCLFFPTYPTPVTIATQRRTRCAVCFATKSTTCCPWCLTCSSASARRGASPLLGHREPSNKSEIK